MLTGDVHLYLMLTNAAITYILVVMINPFSILILSSEVRHVLIRFWKDVFNTIRHRIRGHRSVAPLPEPPEPQPPPPVQDVAKLLLLNAGFL